MHGPNSNSYPMNLPFHLFRRSSAPTARHGGDRGMIHVVTRTEVQWGGRIFKAPSLPTPNQFNCELPFFVSFPSKSYGRH